MPGPRNIAIEVLKILNSKGYEAYLAGGCVRDQLLGRETNDYDIATNAPVETVCTIFKQKDWKVVATGIDHGTVTVVHKLGDTFEVTTYRKDLRTDGRRAEVSHDQVTIEEDASRRDFTINAMYQDKQGKVLDFFKGSEDIKSKLLRFVGDPIERIKEDYLRILRLFRFSSQLSFFITKEALEASKNNMKGLEVISTERITKEWSLLLNGHSYASALDSMEETGALKQLFPQIKWADIKLASLSRLQVRQNRDLAVMAAILLKTKESSADGFISALCLSKNHQEVLRLAVSLPDIESKTIQRPSDAMQILDRCEQVGGAEAYEQLFMPLWLFCAEHPQLATKIKYILEVEQKWGHLRRGKMPVDGSDLMEKAGIPEGPYVGECLQELRDLYRNQVWKHQKDGIKLAIDIAKEKKII